MVLRVFWQRQRNRWSWWLERGAIPVWYAAEYRLSVPAFNIATGFDVRRAESAVSFLLDTRVLHRSNLRSPGKVALSDLLRVHEEDYLKGLLQPEQLGRILALHPSEVPVEAVLETLRRATGATIEAARASLLRRGPTLNTLGGFHHAGRASGGGLSAINDVAVAIAVLRHEGLRGTVAVLDLDAHAPDGIVECTSTDEDTWIGSISIDSCGRPSDVDEVLLPAFTRDADYVRALAALLTRCPKAALTFVIAGGDCLAGDRLGGFSLSLDGLRSRDQMVEQALRGQPSVWLPGGGYSPDAWRALAQTVLVLTGRLSQPLPADDPGLTNRLSTIGRGISDERLGEPEGLDDGRWLDELLPSTRGPTRFLDYYTPSGLEFALHRYGVLEELRRLGYAEISSTFDRVPLGERLQIWGQAAQQRHLLVETVLERKKLEEDAVLYVHWLELRHPIARPVQRPFLPGQSVAGLGMLREVGELFALVARRLGLQGFAFTPAHFHVAFLARQRMRFVDDERQGRFEAMIRDFERLDVSMYHASRAVEAGRCTLNGHPYGWEASTMAFWLDERRPNSERVAVARDSAVFTLIGG